MLRSAIPGCGFAILLTLLGHSCLHAQPGLALDQTALLRIAQRSAEISAEHSALSSREQQLQHERSELLGRMSVLTRAQAQLLDNIEKAPNASQREDLNERAKLVNNELSGSVAQLVSNQAAIDAIVTRRADLDKQRSALDSAKQRLDVVRARMSSYAPEGGRVPYRDDYEDALFAAAKATGEKVPITINSLPDSGALVHYVTKRGRQRGDAPETLERLTNHPQQIYRGCYFIWAEWQGGRTTDQNRHECVESGGITLDLR
jgi:hypothetical protein